MPSPIAAIAATPRVFLRIVSQRQLVWRLIQREVIGRYRGSVMGTMWSFVTPLLMLGVYTFVFSTVLNVRWPTGAAQGEVNFAIILLVGLIIHGLFAECLVRAPRLILENPSYVKRVVFPLEVLPIVALGSALFHALIGFVILLAILMAVGHGLPPTVLLLPLPLGLLALMVLGVSWLLAALGVYLRDLQQVVGLVATALLFLGPILFPLEALPEYLRPYVFLNPLSLIVEETRKIVLWGLWPDLTALGVYGAVALALAWGGFWVFASLRRSFIEVL